MKERLTAVFQQSQKAISRLSKSCPALIAKEIHLRRPEPIFRKLCN